MKKSTLRLLFWNGIVAAYPLALPIREGKSLYWNGLDGLFDWAWAKTEAFRRQIHYIDSQLLLTEVDLALLDFREKSTSIASIICLFAFQIAIRSRSQPPHFWYQCNFLFKKNRGCYIVRTLKNN